MAENFQNFFVTKLREACDATATTIYVDTVPTITEGTLVLEYANSTKHEIIHFTGVSGYGLTGCTRGLENTTAQSHSAGTDVRQNLTAGMIDKIINGVITTENIADKAVTSDKIDFTTLTTGEKIFSWDDCRNDYMDNRNDGWSGYNFNEGSASGPVTFRHGEWGKDAMGGGVTLTSSAPRGRYLVVVTINAGGEGDYVGYRPFRLQKNTDSVTGDVGLPFTGGGHTITRIIDLAPGDHVNLAIYTINAGRGVPVRCWGVGYLLKPAE